MQAPYQRSRGKMSVPACAVEMHMDMSQEQLIWKFTAVRFDRDTRFVRACTVEMHMDMSQESFCVEIYREFTAARFDRDTCFVRGWAVEMHMDISRKPFCVEIRGKLPYASTATLVLREPAQPKRTWTWFFFKGKMPDAPDTTPIKHRPSTLTVRTLQCGHTVRGKKRKLRKPGVRRC